MSVMTIPFPLAPSGYKPCDPQIIRDRVAHMDFCYQELSQLAAERRGRLEESRRLWKFFWEMAEEVFYFLSLSCR